MRNEDYFSYVLEKGMLRGVIFPEVRIVIGTFGIPYFKKAEILEKKNEKEQEILFEFVAWNTHARTMRVALDTFLKFLTSAALGMGQKIVGTHPKKKTIPWLRRRFII